jgi:hypothetical protein
MLEWEWEWEWEWSESFRVCEGHTRRINAIEQKARASS